MEYVTIGKIINTHGVKGELKVDSYTDFAKERFKKNSKVYLGEDKQEMTVSSFREHQGYLLILFKEYEDINLVEKFKNMEIFKSKEDVKPLKDGFYFSDLRDLNVFVENKLVGKVLRVEQGARNNNLRVLKIEDNKECLIPFLPQFIEDVSLKESRIDVIKMEGLL